MKGSTKLSLAIALALVGSDAFALGLGSIQVKSGLNQPLNAEIAVITDSPAEAAGLNVGMATAEDFQRVGLDRARVSMQIDFQVITTGKQPVIKLTTKDPVREPFLDFLVEVNWAKGKVLREYTVLLDPPVTAPAQKGPQATVVPAHEAAPAPAQKLAAESPKPKPAKPAPAIKPPKTVAAEPKPAKPAPPPKPAPEPKPAPAPAAPRTASAGEYGPVAAGETLTEIALATREEKTDVNELMLAMLKANPNAFYKDNINALKRGAILRIPSRDEIKASGNAAAAAAAVREQNQAWSANVPVAKPTLVAKAGTPKESPPPAAPKAEKPAKSSEHLALVPPAAGKGSQTSSDHPGPASGTGGSNTETKAELARTKESLHSREQEVSDLKSRVKDLEDINGKDQRMLTLKQSEIAELQNKLKELEAKEAKSTAAAATAKTEPPKPASTPAPAPTAPVATAPAASTAATTTTAKPAEAGKTEPPKLTAQDIWGKISDTEKASSKPGAEAATSPTTPPAGATGTATPAPATATTAGTPPPNATAPATGTMPAPETGTTTPAPAATTDATTPSTLPATSVASTPPAPKPEATAPVKPKPTPAVTPIAPPEPAWYENTMVLAGAGAALLLVGLLALMRFVRKPRPVLLPVADAEAAEEFAPLLDEDEHQLLDLLAANPGDPATSLRLLSLYYTQRDAAKFEAAAEAMYAHVADPTQPEWQQVKAMGEELVPHNPLFGGHEDMATTAGYTHDGDGHAHADGHMGADDAFDLGALAAEDAKPVAEENFDFDLTDHTATATHAEFAHESPPMAAPPSAAVPAPPPPKADDFFAGEDAIGTKLDLARAYLDMGDPEGARSMLDEVMAEGNEAQKGEARKLLAEVK
jgi:pilus assembly protein FimV